MRRELRRSMLSVFCSRVHLAILSETETPYGPGSRVGTQAVLVPMGRVHLIDAPLASQRFGTRAHVGLPMCVVFRGRRSRARPLVYCRPGATPTAGRPGRVASFAGSPGMRRRHDDSDRRRQRAAKCGPADGLRYRELPGRSGGRVTCPPPKRTQSPARCGGATPGPGAISPKWPKIPGKKKSKRESRYVYRDRKTRRLLGTR